MLQTFRLLGLVAGNSTKGRIFHPPSTILSTLRVSFSTGSLNLSLSCLLVLLARLFEIF